MELQDAINKIKTNFEGVQGALADAQEQLKKVREEKVKADAVLAKARQEHANLLGELEAKRVAADRAAAENGRRIQLNSDQVKELERIKAALDEREKLIARRENEVNAKNNDLAQRQYTLDKRESDMAEKEKEIARRYAKMQEAIA